MGTRNLTVVVKDEKVRVAQYGQWDGYPECTGKGILNILRTDLHRIVNGLENCIEIDEVMYENMMKHVGEVSGSPIEGEWMTMEQSEVFKDLYPEQQRDTGFRILSMIADSTTPIYLRLATEFAADTVFCEWAYVIDLDNGKFETYSSYWGSSEEQGIFATLGENTVTMDCAYNLDELPSDEEYMQQFIEEDE